MADNRFALSDEIVVDQLRAKTKTTRNQHTWLNVWQKWANEKKNSALNWKTTAKNFKCFKM